MKKYIKRKSFLGNIKVKHWSPNINKYCEKTSDQVINGHFFSFEIRVRRKNGKIYLREKSNEKSIFCEVTNWIRDDSKDNVLLIKQSLIYKFLGELEKGFDRLENPIGGKKKKVKSINDTIFNVAQKKKSA